MNLTPYNPKTSNPYSSLIYDEDEKPTPEEEEAIKNRLRALGYIE